ncbi:MAG: hypothetical protein U0Y82_16710 [Thermoleophilia bacterium]
MGPDGNLWGIEYCGRVVRVTPTGVITTFPSHVAASPGAECDGKAILAGPDGNMWFTHDDAIGRITLNPPVGDEGCTTPTITGPARTPTGSTCGLYSLIRIPVNALDATLGADGALWFTTDTGFGSPGAIGRFDITTHTTRIIQVGGRFGSPFFVTGTRDGSLWFTTDREPGTRLGRITPSGRIRWVSLGGVHAQYDITTGADGRVWFPCTAGGHRAVCRLDPGTGRLRAFSLAGSSEWYPNDGIAAAPGGDLWFTQIGRGLLGRITPAGAVLDFPPTVSVRRSAQVGARAVRIRLSCPAAQGEPCTGPVQLWATGSWMRVGAAHYALRPGATTWLTLPLWAPARRAVRRAGWLRVVVTTRGTSLTSGSLPAITLHTR